MPTTSLGGKCVPRRSRLLGVGVISEFMFILVSVTSAIYLVIGFVFGSRLSNRKFNLAYTRIRRLNRRITTQLDRHLARITEAERRLLDKMSASDPPERELQIAFEQVIHANRELRMKLNQIEQELNAMQVEASDAGAVRHRNRDVATDSFSATAEGSMELEGDSRSYSVGLLAPTNYNRKRHLTKKAQQRLRTIYFRCCRSPSVSNNRSLRTIRESYPPRRISRWFIVSKSRRMDSHFFFPALPGFDR